MTIDRDALLKAIVAHPDEDTPRLAYADWLQEHDQPEHAEFIRKQVEAYRLDDLDPRKLQLENEAEELLALHGREWSAAPWQCTHCDYERGFEKMLNTGVGYNENFRDTAGFEPSVWQALPAFSAIASECYQSVVNAMRGQHVYDHVTEIHLKAATQPLIEALTQLPALRRLKLYAYLLDEKTLRQLGSIPLQSLRYNQGNTVEEYTEPLRILCDSVPLQENLQHLDYANARDQTEPPGSYIPGLDKLKKLKSLSLYTEGTAQTAAVHAELAKLPRLTQQLEKLELHRGLQHTDFLKSFTALKDLTVSIGLNGPGAMDTEHLHAFLSSEQARKTLTTLYLHDDTSVTPALSAEIITLLGQCEKLQHLHVRGCRVDLTQLAAQETLQHNLRSLSLSCPHAPGLSNTEAKALGKFTHLRELNLWMDIQNPAWATLLAQPSLRNVQHLGLRLNHVTSDMLKQIAGCPNFPHLQSISMTANTQDGHPVDHFFNNVLAEALRAANAEERVTFPCLKRIDYGVSAINPDALGFAPATVDSFRDPARHIGPKDRHNQSVPPGAGMGAS